MAKIKSFKALRPTPEKAAAVSSVPYDVIYESEVRETVTRNPLSFLRVTRPDGEFPEGTNPSAEEQFAVALRNLESLCSDGALVEEGDEAVYIYRLSTDSHTQTGIVACCSVDEYEKDVIKRHEKTRPDKVEDRTNHMLAVGAQTGLVFLAFRNTDEIRTLLEEAVTASPLLEVDADDGVKHTVWKMAVPQEMTEAFKDVPAIYIADGHHRVESARLARTKRRDANPEHTGDEEYNFFIAGIFPAEDLRIMPYNRAVKDLNGLSEDDFLSRIGEQFTIMEVGDKTPKLRGQVCMYLGGQWLTLYVNNDKAADSDPIERLDVSILQNTLLEPILGIDDPRTNQRITFIGGARGTAELERLVDSGEAKVAFSMYATTMDDLFAVSDIGEIMPPKSTWFEPKLRDGLLIHKI